MGALQFARSRYCAEWGGAVTLRVDSDYRHKQESFKPNEMCGSPRSRDTGLFCLIMSFQQRDFGRGASAGAHRQEASAGGFGRGLRQGHFSWGDSAGVHRQEDLAGCYCRGTSTGMLRQGGGASAGALREGGFGRGTSTFSKYYEFPVTINGNIRLYCGTTRKRRQEKDYKRKQ